MAGMEYGNLTGHMLYDELGRRSGFLASFFLALFLLIFLMGTYGIYEWKKRRPKNRVNGGWWKRQME
jgi:nicotinamide riboside transporter PnuC